MAPYVESKATSETSFSITVTATGVCKDVEGAFEAFFDVSKEDAIDTPFFSYITNNTYARFSSLLAATVTHALLSREHADGSVSFFHMIRLTQSDAPDHIVRLIGVPAPEYSASHYPAKGAPLLSWHDAFRSRTHLAALLRTDGTFFSRNSAWEHILGWGRDELARLRLEDLLHPNDNANGFPWEHLSNEPVNTTEGTFRVMDSEGVFHAVRYHAALEPAHDRVYLHAKLDTPQINAHNEGMWQEIANRLDEGIAVVDDEGNTLAINRALAEQMEHQPANVAGCLFAEESGNEFSFALKTAREHGRGAFEKECGGRIYAFTVFPVRNGTRFACVGNDITDKREREETLLENERYLLRELRLLTRVFAKIENGVFFLDRTLTITYWNKGCEQIFGVGAEEATGVSFLAFFPHETHAKLRGMANGNVTNTRRHLHFRLSGSEGVKRELTVFFSPHEDEGGTGHIGVVVDNTEEHHLHERYLSLKKKKDHLALLLLEAEETQKAKLAREIHDNYAQMLGLIRMRLAMRKEAAHKEERGEIENDIAIVDSLLAMTRNISYALYPPFIEKKHPFFSVINDFLHSLPITTHLSTKGAHERIEASLSPMHRLHIYRILQEATNNAMRHGNASEIRVRLTLTEKNTLYVIIKDNGVGCDTRAFKKGGLGLANIETRALSLGGRFRAKSQKGKGTTIALRIPLAKPPEPIFEAESEEL